MFMIALSILLLILVLILLRNPPLPPPQSPPIRHVSFSNEPPSTPRQSNSTRRLTPLRLSLPTKRRSSSASYTADSVPHRGHGRVPSAPSIPASLSSPRTKFVNPFNRHSRSRTLSPPRSIRSPDTPPSSIPSTLSPPSPQSPVRRNLVNKFKSIFKSTPSQPSPIIQSNPIVNSIGVRFRRKPVSRTQPYGPPWNAPMPVPDFSLSQHSLPNLAHITSPLPRKLRKPSTRQSPAPRRASTSPGQVSPRTFITEIDERLSLLQQQRIHDIISSPHA